MGRWYREVVWRGSRTVRERRVYHYGHGHKGRQKRSPSEYLDKDNPQRYFYDRLSAGNDAKSQNFVKNEKNKPGETISQFGAHVTGVEIIAYWLRTFHFGGTHSVTNHM